MQILVLVFVVASLLIAWAVVWGRRFERRERRIKLGAAPFVGTWHLRVTPAILPVVVLAVVLVIGTRRVLPVVGDRAALAWCALGSSAFAFALAAADGLSAVLGPVVDPNEYWVNLRTLPKATVLLRNFTNYDFMVDRTVHLRGHPPGFILLIKGLAAVGLHAPWVTGALSFLGAAFIVPAVALTTRAICGRDAMRRMLPFFTVTPFAVWLGTSADAFFAAVVAWGIACATIGVGRASVLARVALGFASGGLLGGALFCTYGAATLGPLVAVTLFGRIRTRRAAVLHVAASALFAVAIVAGIFARFGFVWFRGLRLTNKFYWNGSAYFRTWTYFLLANVAVLIVAVGPAVVAGIARLRNRELWTLVGGALACLVVAEASQYSKGEVERIWLLFMPWLVPATAALSCAAPPSGSAERDVACARVPLGWLSLQAGLAIGLQMALRSKW